VETTIHKKTLQWRNWRQHW